FGAELTLVKTDAAQTMLAPDAYARIVDISDHQHSDRVALTDEITEALAETRFDGMLCLHDEAVELGALLAQKLGLSFPTPEVAHRTVNKSAMRARLDEAGLGSVAHGVVVGGGVEWSGAAPTSEIVLKPVDGRASRGVTFHRCAVELQTWLDDHPGEVEGYLVEERKLGREFSVESLIVRSGDAWHGVTAKTTSGAVESGHLHPAPLGADERARIVATATKCLDALGIDRGLLHTEVIVDNDGAAHVVETHLRGGGDNILDLVRLATGLDLPELYVRDVLEGLDAIPAAINLGFASSQFAFPVETGVILEWDRVEEARAMPGVEAVTTLLNVGERVSPKVTSSYGRSVCALAHAADPTNAYKRARAAALTPQPVVEPV
ncbi:ATP-grasp domain-containing protein, partial [Mycobacterium sp.]|uniref:ATP-grasp domain-containing protein n=1 Tax=Mycobacterium sp. TaxID=1785 RepID=UPI002D91038E|nr:ATP-grasp domain-containing protein [Mycobacterium sp.]